MCMREIRVSEFNALSFEILVTIHPCPNFSLSGIPNPVAWYSLLGCPLLWITVQPYAEYMDRFREVARAYLANAPGSIELESPIAKLPRDISHCVSLLVG